MRPALIVPVDFSENAFNAYLYANSLAYHLDYSIHLVHVAPMITSVEGLPPTSNERIIEELTEKLKSFSRWHPNESVYHFYPVETTFEVMEGTVAASIVQRADPTKYRFIICGTRDKHSQIDRWLGTVSSEIAVTAKVPVILVPSLAKFTNLDKVVVACDHHANDDYVLAQIAILSDWFESQVHFVHVKSGSKDDFAFVENDILDTLLTYQKKALNVQMATIEGTDVVESIFGYATTHQADLLIFISERLNFFQQLVFQSMTRKAVLATKIPTMIMQVL